MASTFSPSLRLELIGDGDQSGIWGQTTNNNLGGLVEQAIGGVVTITLVDANYTLTNFNGVVDEARNAVIIATGALSAQRNIIAPLVEKTYIVRNNTTGGFGVQIIGPSGTGVIIPNGVTTTVYCDGTNFLPASTGSTGNQSINGNLLVTGTTTLVGALGGSTAVFSGAISSVNPTFTGTPTAPTAPAGTNTTQLATTAFVQGVAGSLGTMSTQNANAVNITGGTISGLTSLGAGTGNFSGNLASLGSVSGASGIFGAVSGTTGTFTGAVSGTTGTFSGAMSAASLAGNAAIGTGATGTWGISVTGSANSIASGGSIASNVTATTQAPGTNNTTVATTAFVGSAVTAATGSLGTMSTQNANAVNITGGSITGITDLAVADGGTGASSFAANNVLLGNGSSSFQAVAPGASGNILTSNGSTWQSTASAAFGVGQSWQNLTGSRATDNTYTNTSGKPIFVIVQVGAQTNGIYVFINGTFLVRHWYDVNGGAGQVGYSTSEFIVGNGDTYYVTGGPLRQWWEFR